MTLRAATPDDAQRLYDWRLDPLTQAMSVTTGPQTLADHVGWLGRVLADPRVRLYIAEINGHAVGTGRLNLGPNGRVAEVSLAVAPDVRGRGHAAPLLEALADQARAQGCKRLVAHVRGRNRASLRAFLSVGYDHVSPMVRLEKML